MNEDDVCVTCRARPRYIGRSTCSSCPPPGVTETVDTPPPAPPMMVTFVPIEESRREPEFITQKIRDALETRRQSGYRGDWRA